MAISIDKAMPVHLKDCVKALLNSKHGEVYFKTKGAAQEYLKEGIAKGEIYVALDSRYGCVGYAWFTLNGMFYKYPYLKNIAVKELHRGRSIGKKLLAFFESTAFKSTDKVFLTTGDFNTRAQKLYKEVGYRQVGAIPNLFKQGITEYLMVKSKSE